MIRLTHELEVYNDTSVSEYFNDEQRNIKLLNIL